MIMNNAWIEKELNGYTFRYFNNHTNIWRPDIISNLRQSDFDFMLSHFTIMQLQTNIEALPYYYIFPTHGVRLVEIRVQLIKHTDLHYTIDLNLGGYFPCLSEMNQMEFEELIRDLTMLQTREIGSKVYFPTMAK